MSPLAPSRLVVVGIGADGWPGVPDRLRTRIEDAEVVLGGHRQLALLPEVRGQLREPWPAQLREGVTKLLEKYAGRRVVVLASGDPLVSGIGSTLVDLLGVEAVEIEPAVSSVALARARMGWPAESVDVVTAVGRDPSAVLRHLAPGHRLLVLSADESTAAQVARLLATSGYGASRMTVLGDLGATDESRVEGTAATWAADVSRLNVVALELDGPVVGSWSGGLPDEVFEHDGQLTKRDLRVSALARLAPLPGQLLWDVGAGAGSVGIEWMRAHRTCRAFAVEADPDRADRIGRNAERLGVPALEVVRGRAPEALADLPAPDAAFVGGGATAEGVLDACLAAIRPGGRLVAHAVTLETEALLVERYTTHGGELTRIHVERAAPIGSFTGWTPTRAVTQWTLTR